MFDKVVIEWTVARAKVQTQMQGNNFGVTSFHLFQCVSASAVSVYLAFLAKLLFSVMGISLASWKGHMS